MFKFVVVLFVFVSAGCAAPGFVHQPHALPAAVSHSSRIDVFSKPIVTPILGHHYEHNYGVPLGYSAPSVSQSSHFEVHPPPHAYIQQDYGYGGGYGYGNGFGDVHGVHPWI